MKHPFFSIIIPTYNKSKDISRAIDSVLTQNYKNFELIISDNNSNDKTKELIGSYKDKRIVYSRNKKNIGWIRNCEKGINLARGEYVILLGDDDYICSKNSLFNLSKTIKGKNFGYIRLNYVSSKDGKKFDFRVNKFFKKDMILKPHQNNNKIFSFIQNTDPFFITGICFKKNFPNEIKFIDSEFVPWFNIIYYNAQKYGGYYHNKYFFIAKWVSKPIHPFYVLRNKKFPFEKYLETISKLISQKKFQYYKRKILSQVISLFPLIKISMGNRGLIKCAKRVLYLSHNYKFSLHFWINFFSSIFLPNFIIERLKGYYLNLIIKDNKIKNNLKWTN